MMSSSDHETSQAQGGVRASDRLRKKTTRPRASRGDVEPRKAARGDTRQLQYKREEETTVEAIFHTEEAECRQEQRLSFSHVWDSPEE